MAWQQTVQHGKCLGRWGTSQRPLQRRRLHPKRCRPAGKAYAFQQSEVAELLDSPVAAGPSPSGVSRITVRRGQWQDVVDASELIGRAFAETDAPALRGVPGIRGWVANPEADAQRLEQKALEYELRIADELRRALDGKQRATVDMREWILFRRYTALKAEIAALKGSAELRLPQRESVLQQKQLQKARRARMFTLLLAHDQDGRLLGAVTLSMLRCEAVLPPPFPTNKPFRFYMCNLSVAKEARRKGVASALLQASSRLGRRWGQDSCWLHVETSNTQALMLYEAAGFQQVASVRRPNDMFQKCYLLMRPLPQPPAPRLDPNQQFRGGEESDNGTFIWR